MDNQQQEDDVTSDSDSEQDFTSEEGGSVEDDSRQDAERNSEGRPSAREEAESGSESGSNEESGDGPDLSYRQIWDNLERKHKEVILEMPFVSTIGEAAERTGYAKQTVYNWNYMLQEQYGIKLQDIADMMADEREKGLRKGLSALSGDALNVLRRALDPDEEISRVEKESAEYILNRVKGKPTRKSEVEMSGGLDINDSDEEALDEMLSHLDGDEEEGEE